ALSGDEASQELSPLKQAKIKKSPEPYNLVVEAHNVADFGYSNKNSFELYINDKLIEPINEITNATGTYKYRLRLQPGFYDIKGKYIWHGGWSKEKTEVTARDLVQINENEVTVMEVAIRKNWRGIPLDDEFFFDVSHQPVKKDGRKSLATQERQTSDEQFAPVKESISESQMEEDRQSAASQPQVPSKADKITQGRVRVQINTEPENCDVIIDDQMVGQSPVSAWVDNTTDHVVQIKHDGYKTIFRYLDRNKLQTSPKLIIIERLEAIEE
ncbi:PEGA domain-containing protein, partial [Candidatus Saccharibacteria bacterium]|nr:PEGA domain-containing protein [Calditrichia bacterium]NIV71827.1 PEGA domain-containing protein [Calditrichia bacterium]NIV98562.1 PEGA domain-containing protein [Candidatus Saccharibacteria bacterium]NIW79737.1 PEGA domain-containing protein [Calditrichia bacterium]